jgi:hypothetical protein
LCQQEQTARTLLDRQQAFTLIKFHFDQAKISYLYYPEFDQEPHPLLRCSTIVDWLEGTVEIRDYSEAPNPPLLHRKEARITVDYPHYTRFAHLTQQQVAMGLLDNSREIGTQLNWERRLTQQGIEIHNHALACPLKSVQQPKPKIQRHRAAIARATASKPVRLAVEAGLFPADTTTSTTAAATGPTSNTSTDWASLALGGSLTLSLIFPTPPPTWSTSATSSTSLKTPSSGEKH